MFRSTVGVLACYLWYVLSSLALLLGTTLLAFRIAPVPNYLLLAAAGMAVVEVLRRRARGLPRRWSAPARAFAVLLGAGVMLGGLRGFPSNDGQLVHAAFEDYYPTGHTATGHADPKDGDYRVPPARRHDLDAHRTTPWGRRRLRDRTGTPARHGSLLAIPSRHATVPEPASTRPGSPGRGT